VEFLGDFMNEKALGQRLQLARKRAGLTQQELCQKAGLSYSTLAKIERGAIRSPSVFTVASIATATGTPLENLLDLRPSDASSPSLPVKKRSKNGVTFVFIDISGTMIHFYHKVFNEVAKDAQVPVDLVEALFWRIHDELATGRMTFEEFNSRLGEEYSIEPFNWVNYYRANIEPIPHVGELVDWIAQNYKLGILSNNFPGITDMLRQEKIIPDVHYEVVVDSASVGLVKPDPRMYEKAQEMAAVEPREILLIDNERPNLTAADHAGWQVVMFDELDPESSIQRVKKALEF
jgi:FMN phosphatase YigB (HAD superfamily)/DNA-binding XRE family transcriptional regulator